MPFEKIISVLLIAFLGLILFFLSNQLARNEIFMRLLGNHGSIKIMDKLENQRYVSLAYKFCGAFLILVSMGLFCFFLFH